GEAVRAGHLVVTDLTRSRVLTPAVRERVAAGCYHTQLSLPIIVDDRIWGVMALISREPRTFDGDELTLLQAVAHHVGQAVARAALFGETRATTRRLETLTRLAQTLTATQDRKSTRLNSSHGSISYAVFCLKKKRHDRCGP